MLIQSRLKHKPSVYNMTQHPEQLVSQDPSSFCSCCIHCKFSADGAKGPFSGAPWQPPATAGSSTKACLSWTAKQLFVLPNSGSRGWAIILCSTCGSWALFLSLSCSFLLQLLLCFTLFQLLNCSYLNPGVLPFSDSPNPTRARGSKQVAVWYSVAAWG